MENGHRFIRFLLGQFLQKARGSILFKMLGKLGYSWADKLYHLSYGMVELPEGKMKSREGTVVDADDLMEEVS